MDILIEHGKYNMLYYCYACADYISLLRYIYYICNTINLYYYIFLARKFVVVIRLVASRINYRFNLIIYKSHKMYTIIIIRTNMNCWYVSIMEEL